MNKLRVGSLFSGIAGIDLAMELTGGFEVVLQSEKDKFARRVLKHHYPHVPIIEDVKDVTVDAIQRRSIGKIDVLTGGFPCQDVSMAGQRKGLAGKRSGLWFEYHRIIKELLPRWVVIENVTGLLSSNGGRDFAVILRGLVECGYCVAYRVLDAQYFGVPQRRRRVFIVGCLGSGRAAEVLFERKSSTGDIKSGRETQQEIASTIGTCAANRSNTVGWDNLIPYRKLSHSEFKSDTIGGTLRSRDGRDFGDLIVSSFQEAGDREIRLLGDVSASVTSTHPSNNRNMVIFQQNGSQEVRLMQGDGKIAGALTSAHGQVKQRNLLTDCKYGIRRLTPLECERLQGFPDGWTAVENMSDTQRYKMLGNAVAVPVLEWLARRLLSAEHRRRMEYGEEPLFLSLPRMKESA